MPGWTSPLLCSDVSGSQCPRYSTHFRMVYCIAYGCSNGDREAARGISFFCLPLTRKDTLRKWLLRLRLKDPPLLSNSRVCSKHFTPDCFVRDLRAELLHEKPGVTLREGAVPTIFSFRSAVKERTTGSRRRHIKVRTHFRFLLGLYLIIGSARSCESVLQFSHSCRWR